MANHSFQKVQYGCQDEIGLFSDYLERTLREIYSIFTHKMLPDNWQTLWTYLAQEWKVWRSKALVFPDFFRKNQLHMMHTPRFFNYIWEIDSKMLRLLQCHGLFEWILLSNFNKIIKLDLLQNSRKKTVPAVFGLTLGDW